MVNKPQDLRKKEGVSKFFKSVVLTGTTLLVLLQPGFSKNNDKVKAAIKETLEHYDAKAYQVQEDKIIKQTYTFDQGPEMIDGGNDAFNFAMNNVDKYYPDMRKHLEDMLKQFGTDTERRDIVTKIFNETFISISDPKQRTGAIIYALEGYIFITGSDFSDKYDSDITDATFLIMEKAEKKYETRLKARLVDIEKIHAEIIENTKRLEQHKQELAKNKQELAKNKQELAKNKQELAKADKELINILNKVSSQDVKDNERIRNLVIETKALFFKYGKEINPHIDELFTLVP